MALDPSTRRSNLRLARLAAHGKLDGATEGNVLRYLPKCARPLFVRLGDAMPTTTRPKCVETRLVDEGFDPSRVRDPLYLLEAERYVPLDVPRFERLRRAEVRL